MFLVAVGLIAGLLPFTPAILYAFRRRGESAQRLTRRLAIGLGGANVVVALMAIGVLVVWFLAPSTVEAAGLVQTAEESGYRFIAAAIAVSVGSLGAAWAVSTTGSAAVGAISEQPEIFGRALIFVGLAEGVAIYGLIIAFMMIAL
jgi:V/A-type H+-transporting ATPase subunit K